jgi:hypothetical protein
MRTGADRVDVEYVWPTTLRSPSRPPTLVYLDLNHWVSLSKAMANHVDGRDHEEILRACLRAVEDGIAVFPISDTLYTEISKIRQYRQRRALREVIEAVSRFMVVTSRPVVSAHEVEALLDSLVGPNPMRISTMDYLDWGVARAFGRVGGFRIRSRAGEDVTAHVRSSHPNGPAAFDLVLASAELELNRRSLDGPTPDEEPRMRELGWNPLAAFAVAERRAAEEVAQVARFNSDSRWRRGRIRDVVSAREVLIEINELLASGLARRGHNLGSVLSRPEATRRALDSMPSFDVAVTLKTEYHRDPSHRWRINDVHDIDALGSTIPYCDIVVTDKEVAGHAIRSGLATRLNTAVLSQLSDLVERL